MLDDTDILIYSVTAAGRWVLLNPAVRSGKFWSPVRGRELHLSGQIDAGEHPPEATEPPTISPVWIRRTARLEQNNAILHLIKLF